MKFLTFLNYGCIDICKNMLKSAELVHISKEDFLIYCLDKKTYDSLSEYPNRILYSDQPITEYQNWSFDPSSDFRKIVKNKWKIIQDAYKTNKNLCWVDTDIVFRQDPRPTLMISEGKILCQTDVPGSPICSGFMAFKDTEESQRLIDECASMNEEDDQLAINQVGQKYQIGILHPRYFPNGHLYYKHNMKQDAVIVHNNHMVGIDTKIQHFKNEGLWFI